MSTKFFFLFIYLVATRAKDRVCGVIFFCDHRGYSAPYGLWFAPYEPQPRGKIVRKGLLESNAVTIGGITVNPVGNIAN